MGTMFEQFVRQELQEVKQDLHGVKQDIHKLEEGQHKLEEGQRKLEQAIAAAQIKTTQWAIGIFIGAVVVLASISAVVTSSPMLVR